MDDALGLRPLRIYFTTSSKEGMATLSVEHTWSTEVLTLPIHPLNAVPEALDLLEPAFSHYVAQWEKYMVPDVEDTDAVGFWIPPASMPIHIAPLENWEQLSEIAWRHTPESIKEWLGHQPPNAISKVDPNVVMHGNIDHYVVRPEELGIEVWSVEQ